MRALALLLLGLIVVGAAPVPANSAASLPFDEALRLVLQKTLAVKQADDDLQIAVARREQAEAVYLPDVFATGTTTRTWPMAGSAGSLHTAGVSADVNLYRFGGDRAGIDAAVAREQQASAMRADAVLSAERVATEALLSIVALELELAIDRDLLRAQQGNLDMARKLYKQGRRPAQDVDKVEIDAANEESRLRDTELRLVEARATLRAITGTAVAVEAKWPWLARFKNAAVASVGSAAKRPDREVLAANVRALDAEIGREAAKLYPTLDAKVGPSFTASPENGEYTRSLSGTLTLTVPLFDRYSASTERRAKELSRARAVADLEAKDRSLASESEAARAGYASALETARIREKTLATVRSLYEHSLKGFQAGVLSANELSIDRARLHETEKLTVRGWEAVHRYYARVCQSLGKSVMACDA